MSAPYGLMLLFDSVYRENIPEVKRLLLKYEKHKNTLKRFVIWDLNKSFPVDCSVLFSALYYSIYRTSKTKIKKVIKILIKNGCEIKIDNVKRVPAGQLFKMYEMYANILDEMNLKENK